MTRILLVEDNPKHLADAKTLLEERVRSGVIGGVDYASTLRQAMESLRTGDYTGMLLDVFFPNDEGETEQPNCVKVDEYALDKGMPFVLVTSTYHHGRKTEPVSKWAREKHMELVDRFPKTSEEEEAPTKEWEGAYLALAYLIEGKNSGEITITSEGLSRGKNILALACNMEYERGTGDLKAKLERGINTDPILKRAIQKYCQGMW